MLQAINGAVLLLVATAWTLTTLAAIYREEQ